MGRGGGLDEGGEFLYEVLQFGGVVFHVLVAIGGVPVGGEAGVLVGGDVFLRAGDVIRDLVAGFIIAAALEGELVGGGAVAGGALDFSRVLREGVLERVGLCEPVDGPLAVSDF